MLVLIRVVIGEDNLVVREGLEQVLASQPNVGVIGSFSNLPSLLEAVDRDPPDVVLTDIRMPPTSTDEGIRAATILRETHPSIGVGGLSQFAEPTSAPP